MGGIARRRRRIKSGVASFWGANRAAWVLLTRTAAIAQAVRGAGCLALVEAGVAGIRGAGCDIQATSLGARDAAASASAGTATFATEAIHALSRIALGRVRTKLTILLLSAQHDGAALDDGRRARMAGLAIGVAISGTVPVADAA